MCLLKCRCSRGNPFRSRWKFAYSFPEGKSTRSGYHGTQRSLGNRFESTHDSNSISESWINSTHYSSDFPGNWRRINLRLKRIPQVLIQIDHASSSGFPRNQIELTHDSKCFPTFYSNRLMTLAEKNDSESANGSILSHEHVFSRHILNISASMKTNDLSFFDEAT